jgi:hypothetical protein
MLPRASTLTSPGRISAEGFIQDLPYIASTRDTASTSSTAVPPESVLFRRKNAPIRYEETDFYFANDSLSPDALPNSDLLKSLHCYASDFYSRATLDGGKGDWRSMDETALLAIGILMEEVCRDSLGKSGDLVFTEGEVRQEDANMSEVTWKADHSIIRIEEAHRRSGKSRAGKRRKLGGITESTPKIDDY